jgi:transcriptional regulator with XRE-family HTH domain
MKSSAWGERVAARRKALGFTQEDLAGLAGMRQSAVSKIERGEVGVSDATKLRIARCLGCPPGDLFPYEELVA